MSKNEVQKMLLRCIIKKQEEHFVGTCLELSLSAKGQSVSECKRELLNLINNHVKAVFELYEKGENVIITPVKFYLLKKLLFDCVYTCSAGRFSGRIKPPQNSFIKEVVVPAGV